MKNFIFTALLISGCFLFTELTFADDTGTSLLQCQCGCEGKKECKCPEGCSCKTARVKCSKCRRAEEAKAKADSIEQIKIAPNANVQKSDVKK